MQHMATDGDYQDLQLLSTLLSSVQLFEACPATVFETQVVYSNV